MARDPQGSAFPTSSELLDDLLVGDRAAEHPDHDPVSGRGFNRRSSAHGGTGTRLLTSGQADQQEPVIAGCPSLTKARQPFSRSLSAMGTPFSMARREERRLVGTSCPRAPDSLSERF